MIMLIYKFLVFLTLFCSAYTRKQRIHNGTAAENGAYPYQVHLRGSDSKIPFCGGSIINEFYVLTAGHCVEEMIDMPPRIVEVVVGATNLDDLTARYYPSEKFILHENYKLIFFPHIHAINDIALIQVDGPIEFTTFISPIKLPNPGYRIKGMTQVTASGWGVFSDDDTYYDIPSTLQAVNLTVVDKELCKRKWLDKVINIDDRIICVAGSVQEYGQDQNDAGACRGDSGGPVVENNVLVGIISSANSCVDSFRYPHILMNVSYYLPWINERITRNISIWQKTRNFLKDVLFHD